MDNPYFNDFKKENYSSGGGGSSDRGSPERTDK